MLRFTKIENNPHRLEDIVGFIPLGLDEHNPKSAVEQLNDSYRHGGGWQPFSGFQLEIEGDPTSWHLAYPGDPDTPAWAYAYLRDELIIVFRHAWVAIVQPNGTFEVARMD